MDHHILAIPLFALFIAAISCQHLSLKAVSLLLGSGLAVLLSAVSLAIGSGRDAAIVLKLADPHWLLNAATWWGYVLSVSAVFCLVRVGYRRIEKHINENYAS